MIKMILTFLLGVIELIADDIKSLSERLSDKFCKSLWHAVPAVARISTDRNNFFIIVEFKSYKGICSDSVITINTSRWASLFELLKKVIGCTKCNNIHTKRL